MDSRQIAIDLPRHQTAQTWIRKLKCLLIILLGLSLVGCTDFDGSIKKQLQIEYDRMNETGNRAYCYLAGHVRFPYIDGTSREEDKIPLDIARYYGVNRDRLAIRLPLFAELGLLSRSPVSEGSAYYRYTLTPEGEKYFHFEPGKYVPGIYQDLDDSAYFCYGRRVLLKVTDIEDVKAARGEYVFTEISYDNQIEGIPEWAQSEKLKEVYRQYGIFYEGQTYKGSARVMKKNGAYYNAGGVGRLVIGYY